MEISGKTKVCGLIGYPVGHSVSPVIHNSLAQLYGRDVVYVPLPVEPGKLGQAMAGAEAFGFAGMNVTVPYKSEVIPYLREIDPLAGQIGAVNTLVPAEGGYKGYNTDMPGLYRAMCEDGVKTAGEEVILLGAGGVARAIAYLLLEKKAAHIHIVNRNRERAERLTDEVNKAALEKSGGQRAAFATAHALEDYKKLDDGRRYLTIQATSVGMWPHTAHAVIEDEGFYRLVKTGYDVVFNPVRTRFMELVRRSGAEAFGGLKMLLYQGIIAWELWNGTEVSGEAAEEIYRKMKKVLGV